MTDKLTTKNALQSSFKGLIAAKKRTPSPQPDKDQGNVEHIGRATHFGGVGRELIKCDVDMNQLSHYMNSIIQVVNQHAKLLDVANFELSQRPRKTEIGDMFNILSHGFPYEQLIKKVGNSSDTMKPRNEFIKRQLTLKEVDVNMPLIQQQQMPVKDMWEGFDRFSKVNEMNGNLAHELKDFQISVENQLIEIRELIEDRVTHDQLKQSVVTQNNQCQEIVITLKSQEEKTQNQISDLQSQIESMSGNFQSMNFLIQERIDVIEKLVPSLVKIDEAKEMISLAIFNESNSCQNRNYNTSQSLQKQIQEVEMELKRSLQNRISGVETMIHKIQAANIQKTVNTSPKSEDHHHEGKFSSEFLEKQIENLRNHTQNMVTKLQEQITDHEEKIESFMEQQKNGRKGKSPGRVAVQSLHSTIDMKSVDGDAINQALQTVSQQMAQIEEQFGGQIEELLELVNKQGEQIQEINERQGVVGAPTSKELLQRLDDIYKGIESSHSKMLTTEILNLQSRFMREIGRLDNRQNKFQTELQSHIRLTNNKIGFQSQMPLSTQENRDLKDDYRRIESLCKNLAQSVANLENKSFESTEKSSRIALARQKILLDPQNCLACGESEVQLATYNFMPRFDNGQNCRNEQSNWRYQTQQIRLQSSANKKRPTTSKKICYRNVQTEKTSRKFMQSIIDYQENNMRVESLLIPQQNTDLDKTVVESMISQ